MSVFAKKGGCLKQPPVKVFKQLYKSAPLRAAHSRAGLDYTLYKSAPLRAAHSHAADMNSDFTPASQDRPHSCYRL